VPNAFGCVEVTLHIEGYICRHEKSICFLAAMKKAEQVNQLKKIVKLSCSKTFLKVVY